MRLPASLLLACALAAQEAGGPARLDLHTDLGTEPTARIRLAPPGCWDGLLLSGTRPLVRPARGRPAEATVEVWDLAYRETPRQATFHLYLEDLRARLARGFAAPPPSHGRVELAEVVGSDPSNPQKLDLTKVQSMQERYNRLPPNGSPVNRR